MEGLCSANPKLYVQIYLTSILSSRKCPLVEKPVKCGCFYSNEGHISEVLPTWSSSHRPPSDTGGSFHFRDWRPNSRRSGDVSFRLRTNPRICCVYQAWIPQSHMVYVHRTQVPHAAQITSIMTWRYYLTSMWLTDIRCGRLRAFNSPWKFKQSLSSRCLGRI